MTDGYQIETERLMREVARGVAETSAFLGKARLDQATYEAMKKVPRHAFVPVELRDRAYDNRPLPIGEAQTISQPYIVAIMTDMLRLTAKSRVLEVGTGCGYQAAVLAEIAAEVVSLERVGALVDSAKTRLARLGYSNVTILHADGRQGWPAEAPYDGIIATAAAQEVPGALLGQLRPGGRLIIPLGREGWTQSLVLFEKGAGGDLRERCHLPVAFVPMIANIR